MTVRTSWPYVDAHHPSESQEHVQLKNYAVRWLLSKGFSAENIESERYIEAFRGTHGYTDIYGVNDGVEVFIECEANQFSYVHSDLSGGGAIPAKNDEAVYVFRPDGIYLVVEEVVEAEPSQLTPSEETVERTIFELERYSNLPMVDLTAFNDN